MVRQQAKLCIITQMSYFCKYIYYGHSKLKATKRLICNKLYTLSHEPLLVPIFCVKSVKYGFCDELQKYVIHHVLFFLYQQDMY